MKNWIQNVFHTDKWWGKTIFVVLVYLVYWCVFYGSLTLLPENTFDNYGDFVTLILFAYVFIFVPVLSFILIDLVKRFVSIKYPYILNTIILVLSLSSFFFVEIVISLNHWFSF